MSALEDKALVLFSGGQDSATCLGWALSRFNVVEVIGFDYGQRHVVELECRQEVLKAIREKSWPWKGKLADDHLVSFNFLGEVCDTALTQEMEIFVSDNGLPNTFVPGRNLLFFAASAALAYRRGIKHIVGGMCETDYSGYPDCRDDTIKSLQVSLNLGMDSRFVLHTPLMWIDKASTWLLAEQEGGLEFVELIRDRTHSCYLGDRSTKHAWGYGCGACPACQLRSRGWTVYRGALGVDELRN